MKIDRLAIFAALCVAFVLSACASGEGPSPVVMKAEIANYQLPRLPAAGKAIVYVVFEEAWYENVGFDVYLGDQQPASVVGHNKGGQYFYFELAPGEHRIYSKGEKWAELAVSAKAGEVIFVRQELYLGMLEPRVRLLRLDEVEGKYYVSKLKPGLAVTPLAASAPATPVQQGAAPAAATADILTGTVTGGNMAKGVGFSNLNVRLFVAPPGGEPVIFFVRSDSQVFDASGKQVDYLEASRFKGKRVEIRHFLIQDASGGQPGRTDFAYEIGHKGVRTMRVLDQ